MNAIANAPLASQCDDDDVSWESASSARDGVLPDIAPAAAAAESAVAAAAAAAADDRSPSFFSLAPMSAPTRRSQPQTPKNRLLSQSVSQRSSRVRRRIERDYDAPTTTTQQDETDENGNIVDNKRKLDFRDMDCNPSKLATAGDGDDERPHNENADSSSSRRLFRSWEPSFDMQMLSLVLDSLQLKLDERDGASAEKRVNDDGFVDVPLGADDDDHVPLGADDDRDAAADEADAFVGRGRREE